MQAAAERQGGRENAKGYRSRGRGTAVGVRVGGLEDGGCAAILSLDSGTYDFVYLCELTTGDVGAELESGTYDATSTTVTLKPGTASCPDAADKRFGWEVSDNTLTLADSNGALIWRQLPRSEGGAPETGTVVFGCYDGDAFTQMPVQNVD